MKEIDYKEYTISVFSDKFYIIKQNGRKRETALLKLENYDSNNMNEKEIIELAKKVIDKDDFRCERCGKSVPFEKLETNKVGHNKRFCPDCAKVCKKCGANNWEAIGRRKEHSTKHGDRFKCKNCGNIIEKMPTG